MATVVASITDCRSFWREIVVPDYNDFTANIDDLRRAFHCAISLFHLSDWVYVAHKAHIDANFTFRERHGVARPDERTFANALGDLHPDFDLIRGIANSAKHLVLTNRRPHPAAPSHAANTRVQSTGFGEGGALGQPEDRPFQNRPQRLCQRENVEPPAGVSRLDGVMVKWLGWADDWSNVRFAPNSDRIDAPRRTVAECQKQSLLCPAAAEG